MVAHYSFTKQPGLTARDATGKHHGRLVGATWTKGMDDSAVQFDGDDFVRMLTPLLNRQPNYSLTAWVRQVGSPAPFQLYGDYSGDATNSTFCLQEGQVQTGVWYIAPPLIDWCNSTTPKGTVPANQ